MKNLNKYIEESLLDDEDEILATSDEIIIKSEIMKFLHENYFGAKKCTISDKRDVDGKYVVNSTISVMPSKNLGALTNGMFKFGKIGYDFMCHECSSLTSLEGGPERVG